MKPRSSPFQAGLLAAIMAATLQLMLWSSAIAGGFGSAGAAGPPQFHAAYCGSAPSPGGQDPDHDQPAKHAACLLCPVCLALSLPVALPAGPAGPTPPMLLGRDRAGPGGADILLPRRWQAAAFPRGPPLT
jgi:hypothetical protein